MALSTFAVLYIWAIVNIGAGLWEIYAFRNRHLLKLESITLWEKLMNTKSINIYNFWIEGWSEYCKVDNRYLRKPVSYVWFFELLNAGMAFVFLWALIAKQYYIVKLILGIGIINCLAYFATLIWEVIMQCHLENNLENRSEKYSKLIIEKEKAKWWMFPIYYLISGIWLIMPVYLWCNL